MTSKQQRYYLVLGFALLVLLIGLHLMNWSLDFSVFNDPVIWYDIRFPRTMTALFCGILLSVSGLLLQILFNNPLAGPSILGISSGASLGVALAVLTGVGTVSLSGAAFLGALMYSMILLGASKYVKSTISLLLVGIMLSAFTSAFVDILQVFATASKLKFFTLWGMGSLQQVNPGELWIFLATTFLVLITGFVIYKDLSIYTQGETFSRQLGMNIKRFRWIVIVITSLAVAVTTALCGPIAFIGIAVPNMVRIVFKTSNGFILLLGTILFGAIFLLLCDGIILCLDNWLILPINAVTALFGIPFIVWIIVKDVS